MKRMITLWRDYIKQFIYNVSNVCMLCGISYFNCNVVVNQCFYCLMCRTKDTEPDIQSSESTSPSQWCLLCRDDGSLEVP